MGEEEAVLSMESSFKELFTNIYRQRKELTKVYDSPPWDNLSANLLFSAAYLQRLLKLYMPMAPIWSNLLLGNFVQRYGYSSTTNVPLCSCHFGRTTSVSESQMRVLKEAILKNKIYSRVDEVVSRIGDNIESIEIQFADCASTRKSKMRILPAKKQKPAEEQWNKRKKTSRKTGVYTTGKPPTSIVSMMNTRLWGQNDDANLGKHLSMTHLCYQEKGERRERARRENDNQSKMSFSSSTLPIKCTNVHFTPSRCWPAQSLFSL